MLTVNFANIDCTVKYINNYEIIVIFALDRDRASAKGAHSSCLAKACHFSSFAVVSFLFSRHVAWLVRLPVKALHESGDAFVFFVLFLLRYLFDLRLSTFNQRTYCFPS